MAHRSSRADAAARAFGFFGRGTIGKINDGPKLQELDLNLLNDEGKTKIERVQEFGFSSVPMGPSEDQQSGGSGGSGKKSKKYAMAIVAFLSGNRSHGVILGVDDRRHRPRNLKEGESILYDDRGVKVHLTRDGLEIYGGDDNLAQGDDQDGKKRNKKLPITIHTGETKWRVEKDKVTLTVGDNTGYTFEKDQVTIKSPKIILDGTVYLGGKDADKEVSMKGTIDTAGDADVSNLATRAYVK